LRTVIREVPKDKLIPTNMSISLAGLVVVVGYVRSHALYAEVALYAVEALCGLGDMCGEPRAEQSLSVLQRRGTKLKSNTSQPLKLPPFSASIVEHNQTFAQFPGAKPHVPHFTGGSMKYDPAGPDSVMWELHFHSYYWVGPEFADLWMKQVCINGSCTTQDRNGTVSSHGASAYMTPWLVLLYECMPLEGEHQGTSEVGGQACSLWMVQNRSIGNLSVCVGPDLLPRSLIVEPAGDTFGWTNVKEWGHNVTFHDIRVGQVSGIEPLSVGEDGLSPEQLTTPCASPDGAKSIQVLRASDPPEQLGVLEDRDTFDWPGQGVTLGSPAMSKFVWRTYLQLFEVDFDGYFGEFRDCNYRRDLNKNICPPSRMPDTAVTRCSAELLTGTLGMAGMCDDNGLVGSWLTFPHEGKCGDSASVGDGGCTWKMKASKVVLMECMVHFNSTGWFRAWNADFQKAPFPHVIAHVKAAVHACPDVRQHESK